MNKLPVDDILDELRSTLRSHTNTILVAPPGAGKTTRIPLALIDEPWLEGRRILMLEPRRIATRAAARYMAAALGEVVGGTVGYRIKQDTKVGPRTRIEVITEGVLTRLLQDDPSLEGVGIVIFDEFHERSLHGDLGLALCLQSQEVLREDLRILVMSATLETESVSELLNDAPIITSEGRTFPVETRYLQRPVEGKIESAVVHAVQNALQNEQGDILVFLPGAAEIRYVESQLNALRLGQGIRIAPLYGNLPQETQDVAISPAKPFERKIVLATSIAETSLTVEGVRIVVDAGLMRVSRFSPRTGMTRLETIPVSKASADQRRGRAGRLTAGVCYRLWTDQEHRRLISHTTPEIKDADLVPLVLELAVWGVSDPAELRWMDLPPAAAFAEARSLLRELGALHADGAITPHGRRMAELVLHPRLAHMLLKAVPLGLGVLGCELSALLGERDLFSGNVSAAAGVDLRLRVEAFRHQASVHGDRDHTAFKRLSATINILRLSLGIPASASGDGGDMAEVGLLLAFAYPDRIAQKRSTGRFLLSNGRGAIIPQLQPLSNESYLVAVELDDQGVESRIYLAAPVDLASLEKQNQDNLRFEEQSIITWDRAAEAVRSRKQVRLGALILKDVSLPDPNPDEVLEALLGGIAEEGLELLPWTKTTRQLLQRLRFLQQLEPSVWPDVTDEALQVTVRDWLGPYLYGCKNSNDLKRLNMTAILESMLSWDQRRELDELAPTHILVPSGSRIPVDYSHVDAPILAVRLQEMFGLEQTPHLGRGRVPLIIHLLSPAQRPVQVTQDLESFWRTTYFEVRKDLKGRYPKHYWPDNPLEALPTNRVRPRT